MQSRQGLTNQAGPCALLATALVFLLMIVPLAAQDLFPTVTDNQMLQRAAAASGATAIKIEVAAAGDLYSDGEHPISDVIVTWDNGRREQLTHGVHAEQAKLGPDGLMGWAVGNRFIDVLHVQRGRQFLFEIVSAKRFIEDWAFAPDGLVVKSRMAHGPASIELFSLDKAKRIQLVETPYKDQLPSWAKPLAD